MKTTTLVPAAILAVAQGLIASALIITPCNFERAAFLKPLNIAENDTADPADQIRPAEKLSPSIENKTDKSKGVIEPKQNVDPGIVRPASAPDPNSTPVIKPPGTPGGAPGPEPK